MIKSLPPWPSIKAAPLLRSLMLQRNRGLRLFTKASIPSRPSGLAVITGLDPNSTILAENFADITAEFMAMPYGSLEDDRSCLNPLPNDWREISSRLPGGAAVVATRS